jgi:hypothetical protein
MFKRRARGGRRGRERGLIINKRYICEERERERERESEREKEDMSRPQPSLGSRVSVHVRLEEKPQSNCYLACFNLNYNSDI